MNEHSPFPPFRKGGQGGFEARSSAWKRKIKTLTERIEALEDIKLRGLYLHGYAFSADATPIVFDTLEYQQLVDQFYQENQDLVTPVVHRACRESYEFFMTIVEKALNQLRQLEQDG